MHQYFYPVLFCSLLLFVLESPLEAQNKRHVRNNGGSFVHTPRSQSLPDQNCERGTFRSIDGTCNNTEHPEWGAADIPLYRKIAAAYGNQDPLNQMGGQNRPGARHISNLVFDQSSSQPSREKLSSFVFTWGQFLDHDITLTPEGHSEYEPIPLPENESNFTSEIPFFRSEIWPGSGFITPRIQINLLTSWIDASNVYGSEPERANWLRTFQGGKLKTSPGQLLPYNTLDGTFSSPIDANAPSMATLPTSPTKYFVAGDVRANEQPGLTALHTLFVREHNHICDELIRDGFTDDEIIYQTARRRVGAIIQNITYEEFLPALGVKLSSYRGYRPQVRPDIINLFATAGYRLGHTMVTNEMLLLNNNCESIAANLSLIDGFFNPTQIADHGIAPFLKGLAVQTQEEVDAKIIDNLRNFLFAAPGAPSAFGLDLAALNIQRGRDHGLPDYNTIRKQFRNRGADDFRDITSDRRLRDRLEQAYNTVDNVDAWVGLLAEDHERGTSLGATLLAILEEQFERLRDGDFFYFENDPGLNNRDRDEISRISLSDVIERNTIISGLQSNVFRSQDCGSIADKKKESGKGDRKDRNLQPPAKHHASLFNPASNAHSLIITPNPSPGSVAIRWWKEDALSYRLEIIDLQGRQFYQRQLPGIRGLLEEQVHLELPPGLYLVTLRNAHTGVTKKLVILP